MVFKSLSKVDWIFLGLLLLLTFIVFFPVLNSAFVAWDDDVYFEKNELIRSLSVIEIFSSFAHSNYHPLTTLSNAIEYHFFGLHPKIYHLNNLLLHLLNSFLVFYFIRQLNKGTWFAGAVACVFALHPLHVESVAWASERKDVLYAFFYLWGLISYTNFLKRGKKSGLYLAGLLCLAALFSKTAAVSFPLTLLVLEYYFKKSVQLKQVMRLTPFFLLAFIFGVINMMAQQEAGALHFKDYTAIDRVVLAAHAFLFYIQKLFFPFGLSALYGYPEKVEGAFHLSFYLAPLLILSGALLLFRYSPKSIRRDVIFGVLFYTATILLVLQLVPAGGNLTANRFSYLPYIGLSFSLFAAIEPTIVRFKKLRPLYFAIGGIVLFFLCTLSRKQVMTWQNSDALFTQVMLNNPKEKFTAYYNLGIEKMHQGFYEEAVELNNKAIKENPHDWRPYNNRGNSKIYLHDYVGAIEDFTIAAMLDSTGNFSEDNAKAVVRNELVHLDHLVQDYSDSISIHPEQPEHYINRGFAFYLLGDRRRACLDFETAKKLPNSQLASGLTNRLCPK